MARSVGYYCLSGYWYPYRILNTGRRGDTFEPGTTFADVIALYEFDRKVRDLVEGSFTQIHGRHVEEMGSPEMWREDDFWSRKPNH